MPIAPTADMPANRSADPAKDDARLLVKQGRIYLQANDVARARQCAALAQQKNVKWEFYEDTPEKLLGDFASDIRSRRPVEPYKGKGLRYRNEVVKRKLGKQAKGDKKK